MRFFTPDWHSGQLSDEDADAVSASYVAHLEEFTRTASAQVVALANGASLHDALIESLHVDYRRRRVRLRLVAGDLQKGYFLREIIYDGVRVESLVPATLSAVANDSRTELLHDEVDKAAGELYSHRCLFWPDYREIEVVFEQVRISDEPRMDRALSPATARYSESGAPAV